MLALTAVALVRLGPATSAMVHTAQSDASSAELRGVNAGFAAWARSRIGPHKRYWIAPGARDSDTAHQLLTFELSPRLPVDRRDDADAVVWFADTHGPSRLPGFSAVERYAPGFGVSLRTAAR